MSRKATMETWLTLGDLAGRRFDPDYWDEEFVTIESLLRHRAARSLGDFVTFITYGQVGKRVLSPRGAVRYLQVVNIRDTGIDFLIKPDRVAEGTNNDPARSRVQKDDLLFVNNSFAGGTRMLGRCIVVPKDYGKVNVSQHIDVVRLAGIDPYFVGAVIKCEHGQAQVRRLKYGVSSTELSFQQVKEILIPAADDDTQRAVRKMYLRMAAQHEKAMERKAELADGSKHRSGRDRELDELAGEDAVYQRLIGAAEATLREMLGRVEAYIRGEIDRITA